MKRLDRKLTNNIDWDYKALQDFQDFRIEAERKGFRYFLEVFNPNVNPGIPDKKVAAFLNDHIIRTLAGVTEAGRPVFHKVPYNGPGPLEELVSYDPQLIVGILGGCAVNMADGLASLGVAVDCFATLGDPVHPAFGGIAAKCHGFHSWGGEPGRTLAFEFSDGKLMFSAVRQLAGFTPDSVRGFLSAGGFQLQMNSCPQPGQTTCFPT